MAAGLLALLFADFFGRRDLLHLGVFLIVLPLLSVATVTLMKPRLRVERHVEPPSVSTGATARIQLMVTAKGPVPGTSLLTEGLPATFGRAPTYTYGASHNGEETASYEYRIRSSNRGMFPLGPVAVESADPFGLGRARHTAGPVDHLIVTPSPIELPASTLSGTRGLEGNAATRRQANPSNDDVMTREYRHGDPMRRVHWAATARHGELMVRQEESVSTPQATIILDRRETSHNGGYPLPASLAAGQVRSSESFEWCVTTAVSVLMQFIDQGHTVRFLDQDAAPALRSSPSSHHADAEEFTGPAGFHDVAEGLAALALSSPQSDSTGSPRNRRSASASPQANTTAFGEPLMDRLAHQAMHGPIVALLGTMTTEEAHRLAPAAGYGSHAFALLVTNRPGAAHPVLDILRRAGWHALAVSAQTPIEAAWSFFDDPALPESVRATAQSGSV